MSTFLHYVHCKDALRDCSAPGGERCESLTWVDEIVITHPYPSFNDGLIKPKLGHGNYITLFYVSVITYLNFLAFAQFSYECSPTLQFCTE